MSSELIRVENYHKNYGKTVDAGSEDALNVVSVAKILDEKLPKENKDEGDEQYSDLLVDLLAFEVNTPKKLAELIDTHLKKALEADAKEVKVFEEDPAPYPPHYVERANRGVFFSHIGLARQLIHQEFAEKFGEYLNKRVIQGP